LHPNENGPYIGFASAGTGPTENLWMTRVAIALLDFDITVERALLLKVIDGLFELGVGVRLKMLLN
jgi:hypothetical protein